MSNSVENKALVELAKLLHESTRAHVSHFREWDRNDEHWPPIEEVFIAQAQALIDTYAMLPLENSRACSGCRTLTNALNDMDESRRQFILHRDALAALVGASEQDELNKMRDFIACAPVEDPQDKANMIAAIELLMEPINAAPAVGGEPCL